MLRDGTFHEMFLSEATLYFRHSLLSKHFTLPEFKHTDFGVGREEAAPVSDHWHGLCFLFGCLRPRLLFLSPCISLDSALTSSPERDLLRMASLGSFFSLLSSLGTILFHFFTFPPLWKDLFFSSHSYLLIRPLEPCFLEATDITGLVQSSKACWL